MRKVTILVAAAVLMVALAAGTAAAKDGMKTFNFKGTAVSEDGSSISVDVYDGNKRGRQVAEAHEQASPGEPMVFVVRDTTRVEIDDAPASLSEVVAAGGEVRVQSKKAPEDSGSFVARKVSLETDED